MTDDTRFEMAVALGRVEENVKHIRESSDRRLSNTESFQLSVQQTISEHDQRITKIETSFKTSLTMMTVILSVVTVVVNILGRFI